MKISVTKKLLIICLSLLIAVTAGIFAVLQINRNAYAEVAPDGAASYADGDESGETPEKPTIPSGPGEGEIAPPVDPGTNPDDPEWTLTYQEIIFEVGKLEIQVSGWPASPNFDSKPTFNTNPNGTYSDVLVEKIEKLLTNSDFIVRTVVDIEGNEITDPNFIQAGHTYFIHVSVCEEYADSVLITYADGVSSSLAFTAPFPPGTVLEKIDKLSPLEFELTYDGKEIDLKAEILDTLLKDKDHILQFVPSESDSLTQNGAGVFHLRICFIDGVLYCWNSEIKDDRSAVDVVVTIKPKVLEIVTEITDEIYFTGFEIDVMDKIKAIYGDYVVVAYGYTTKQTEAGNYEFNIRINPAYEGSVTWDGEVENGVVTVKWSIKQSIIHGEWALPDSDYGRITITSDTYQGGTAGIIEYVYTDVDTKEVVTELVVGKTYSVKAILVSNSVDWDVDPGEHIFTLTKELVVVERPKFAKDKEEYTGNEITFELYIEDKPITDPEYADKVEIVAEKSDSLTQTAVGKYKVVVRLKDDAYSWPGNVTGEIEIPFEITNVIIGVDWTVPVEGGIPVPSFGENFKGKDLSSIVKLTFVNSIGVEVKRCDLVKGQTYTAKLTLLDEQNYQWKAGAKLEYVFKLDIDLIEIEIPVLSGTEFDFTGEFINVTPAIWEQIKDYVENVSGVEFSQRNAGEYKIILRIIDSTRYWKGGADEYVQLTFTINRAVLEGEWGSDGRIVFTSSFTGDYNEVVEYIYRDSNGNIVSYSDLKDGQTYTASVRLKEGMDKNFDPSKLPLDYTFTFKLSDSGSSFPWWIFLIIAAVIIIIVIIIIIIVMKKRKKDDDYDDFYGDEYYGDDEEGGEGDEEFNPDGYDDYGDYGGEADYGADSY